MSWTKHHLGLLELQFCIVLYLHVFAYWVDCLITWNFQSERGRHMWSTLPPWIRNVYIRNQSDGLQVLTTPLLRFAAAASLCNVTGSGTPSAKVFNKTKQFLPKSKQSSHSKEVFDKRLFPTTDLDVRGTFQGWGKVQTVPKCRHSDNECYRVRSATTLAWPLDIPFCNG